MNGDQFGEFAFGYWGLKGYKNLFGLKFETGSYFLKSMKNFCTLEQR